MSIELCRNPYVAPVKNGSLQSGALLVTPRASAFRPNIRGLQDQKGATLFLRHRSGIKLTFAEEKFARGLRRAIHPSK
jgi:DNA-binding transcriptional LysR family regulator